MQVGARKGPPLPGHHCPRPTHQYTTTPVHHCTRLILLHHYTSSPLQHCTSAASSQHQTSALLHHCTTTTVHQCTTTPEYTSAASCGQYTRGAPLHWCSHSKLPHSSAVRSNVLNSYTTSICGGILYIHIPPVYMVVYEYIGHSYTTIYTPKHQKSLPGADIHLQAKYRAINSAVQDIASFLFST